jgi:hypothetical protein
MVVNFWDVHTYIAARTLNMHESHNSLYFPPVQNYYIQWKEWTNEYFLTLITAGPIKKLKKKNYREETKKTPSVYTVLQKEKH